MSWSVWLVVRPVVWAWRPRQGAPETNRDE